jgi:hypothetical protein
LATRVVYRAGEYGNPGTGPSLVETDPSAGDAGVVRVAVRPGTEGGPRTVAKGSSNAQIAKRPYLSESTVKQHLRAIYKVLGMSGRKEAAKVVGSEYRRFTSNGACSCDPKFLAQRRPEAFRSYFYDPRPTFHLNVAEYAVPHANVVFRLGVSFHTVSSTV